MNLKGFIGPSARSRSHSFNVEATYNLYLELKEAGSPKSGAALFGVPGCEPWYQLPAGPVRALFTQNGRTFAIGGNAFCELYPNRTFLVRGQVAIDAFPASFASSGNNSDELMITSGGYGYAFDLAFNDFEQITDDGFPYPVTRCGFVGSSFLALQAHTNRVYYSDLNDVTSWSGINFFQTSLTTDDKPAMIVNHGEIWLPGTQRSEIWAPTDGSNTPFQPIGGTVVEQGIIAPWSLDRLDNTIFWLGGDERGANVVFRMNGYTPERVSTFAVETYLNQLQTTTNAIAWTYQEEGHAFYLLYLPAADTTLCYDVSTDSWTQRALWDPDLIRWTPYVGRCHTFAFNSTHLIGDIASGAVYKQSLDLQDFTVIAA